MSAQQDKALLDLITGPAARPHTFLSLAPATSVPSKTIIVAPPTEAELLEAKARRSSSMSSTSSQSKRRFLKLGAGEGDWSEEVIE